MNGPQTPMFLKSNRFTQLMDRIAEQNAAEGKPAGRSVEQLGATGRPMISAAQVARMTPQQKVRTDYVPEMEDPNIAMRANARAAALGITNDMIPTTGDDLPGDIGRVSADPSDAEIDAMLAAARRSPPPGIAAAGEGAAAPGPAQVPAAAGSVALPRGRALGSVRTMPNFANVEGFDLIRKVAVVDGMEFMLADADVVDMKKFAIQVVLDNVTFQLAQALMQLGLPQEMAEIAAEKMRETVATGTTPGGMSGREGSDEAVQQVPPGPVGTTGVLQGQSGTGRVDATVSDVYPDVQRVDIEETSGQEIQQSTERNRERAAQPFIMGGSSDDTDYLLGNGDSSPS